MRVEKWIRERRRSWRMDEMRRTWRKARGEGLRKRTEDNGKD